MTFCLFKLYWILTLFLLYFLSWPLTLSARPPGPGSWLTCHACVRLVTSPGLSHSVPGLRYSLHPRGATGVMRPLSWRGQTSCSVKCVKPLHDYYQIMKYIFRFTRFSFGSVCYDHTSLFGIPRQKKIWLKIGQILLDICQKFLGWELFEAILVIF